MLMLSLYFLRPLLIVGQKICRKRSSSAGVLSPMGNESGIQIFVTSDDDVAFVGVAAAVAKTCLMFISGNASPWG